MLKANSLFRHFVIIDEEDEIILDPVFCLRWGPWSGHNTKHSL